MEARKIKNEIRERIWKIMEERNIATFPRPVINRIPNFVGSEIACLNIAKLNEFKKSEVIKVNPDSPQRKIREIILSQGKTLIFATPRLKEGFLEVKARNLSQKEIQRASTIKGAFVYGRKTHPKDLPMIDMIIAGSVAVTKTGERIGKGEGYSEIEFAILLHYGKIDKNIPIVTSVHDIQIVDYIPLEPFDVTIDFISTPSQIIKVEGRKERPDGILWDLLPKEKLNEIPLLSELKIKS